MPRKAESPAAGDRPAKAAKTSKAGQGGKGGRGKGGKGQGKAEAAQLVPSSHGNLTLAEMQGDPLYQVATDNWLGKTATAKSFKAPVVEQIYEGELQDSAVASPRLVMLEFSGYLENFLWPGFSSDKASRAHVLSIMIMVNEKFREGVDAWACFHSRPEEFPKFVKRVLKLRNQDELSLQEQTHMTVFLIRCFQSFEEEMIRKEFVRLVGLPLWFHVNPVRLSNELKKTNDQVRKRWRMIEAQAKKNEAIKQSAEATFIPEVLRDFLHVIESLSPQEPIDEPTIQYLSRFFELLIDLLSQLPTRRFFHALIEDWMVVPRCQQSALLVRPEARLCAQLLEMLKFYLGFEMDNYTGNPLSEQDLMEAHYTKLRRLQLIAYKHFMPKLSSIAMTNIASIETRGAMDKILSTLSQEELQSLASMLGVCHPEQAYDKVVLREALVQAHEKRLSQVDALNEMPLYPTEAILWDENLVPSDSYQGADVLALPKLNLQFLTLHDYLLRNFNLFRLEATYEIREDIADVITRMGPRNKASGGLEYAGWSRMGLAVGGFTIRGVGKPNLGEIKPSEVQAEVMINLSNLRGQIRNEWSNLRQHDVLFLVKLVPPFRAGDKPDPSLPFPARWGIKHIRGVEIREVVDSQNHVFTGMGETADKALQGDLRCLRVNLDSAQYQQDITNGSEEDVYAGFDLIVRRKPKENNFKAVLECIRDLMSTETVIPNWLLDVFLGYGNPAGAAYFNLPQHLQIQTIDFRDTFLSWQHLTDTFADKEIVCSAPEADRVPPFKVSFPADKESNQLAVEPYKALYMGPYPEDLPKANRVPFTPKQVEAIRSGINPGLTQVVGPPGTGKTDVAVQIMTNLYHNFPGQRTLIITHSNQALNDIFEKIMERDVNEIHLLRLGRGEEDLATDKDFSKYGRVNFMLERRLEHLAKVEKLGQSLGLKHDVGYTCETAERFFLFHIQKRIEVFEAAIAESAAEDRVQTHFPFALYFADAPQPLFSEPADAAEDLRVAEGCFRHLRKIFAELEETRAFELLRTAKDRGNYLSMRQAKIIAMTCTHAALKRRDLVAQAFQYDNLLMEESAQILEVETFIPMLLQNPDSTTGKSRLKRVILIGDHHQLPPVVKNMAFQKYSHFEQSLFTRFVRLGIPTIDLNAQGRMRPDLAALYSWRYKELGDLAHCSTQQSFVRANPGFAHTFQFVDIPDFNGKGEFEPSPHFTQNLGEAEYCVALFMYMRLLGYPAEKISILTTYRGQKHLIRDVVQSRCAWNPALGEPGKISTVDKYQGQQNDFVIVSMVRTKNVGHIRDVRRLVVALSRARLGLYVVGRRSLFENCYELAPAFSQLLARPTKLQILPEETQDTTRKAGAKCKPHDVEGVEHLGLVVHQMMEAAGLNNGGAMAVDQ